MMVVVSVIVGWLLLSHQTVFSPALSESVNLVTFETSASVLVIGFLLSYFLVFARRDATSRLLQTSPFLQATSTFLIEGMWFDRLYFALERFVARPLVRGAKSVQSGLFGCNMALLFSALVVLVLLIATGVI